MEGLRVHFVTLLNLGTTYCKLNIYDKSLGFFYNLHFQCQKCEAKPSTFDTESQLNILLYFND